LYKDINRGSYNLDGIKIATGDDIDSKIKTGHPDDFLKKLPDLQKKSLNIVVSQPGPIALVNTLLASPENPVVFFENPDKEVEYHLDESNKVLIVHIQIRQSPDLSSETFNILRDNSDNKNARWYPELSLNATFTITEDGMVDCSDFKFNTNTENVEIADQAVISTTIEKTGLLTSRPGQGQLLTWLQQFIRETDREFVDFIQTVKDEKRAEMASDAGALRDFSRQQLTDRLAEYSSAEKHRMLMHLEGSFGQRLRAVSTFAVVKVAGNDAEPEIISMANRYPGALDDLIMVLRDQLDKKERPIPAARELHALKASEMLALSQVGIKPEMLV
jgi:hypothetical protein